MASVPLMKNTKLEEWVVQLERELEEFSAEEEKQHPIDEGPPMFFRVPKVLLNSSQKSYSPSLVSMGPYHFGKDDLNSMERHKSEAVLRMQKRMQKRSPDITMKSIVERDIVAMDNRVRKCYVEEIPYNSNVLAWILIRDACFLFEFVVRSNTEEESEESEESEELEKYHPVFHPSMMDPICRDIASDLILLENQIPLFILERLVEIETGSETVAKEKLQHMLRLFSGNDEYLNFFCDLPPYDIGKSCHLLDMVFYRNVGPNLEPHESERWQEFFAERATKLVKAGVQFRAVPSAAIESVKFDAKTSTLYLPEVRLDKHRHKLMRNLIALEVTSEKYRPRPFTFYAMFMDELIDSKEDVDVLTEAGIIKNSFGSNEQVAQCFTSLTKGIGSWSGGCRCIEEARKGLDKYMKRSCKILWNQFLSAYCSKPWLVAGSVGATLLLLMTMLQVFCLFYTCNPNSTALSTPRRIFRRLFVYDL